MNYLIISIATISVANMFLIFKHVPKRKLTQNIQNSIAEKGLIHFTKWENALAIKEEGLIIKNKKAMNIFEKDMVWFYLNNEYEFIDKCNLVRSKGHRKDYNAVVYFRGLTDKQYSKMKYRKNDMAIVHIGDFKTDDIEIAKLY